MTAIKEKSCADRIVQQLENRTEYIKGLMDKEAFQELAELPLGIENVKETTITLSYGGPADYLHITHYEGDVLRVVYRFSDWYDTATYELDASHPLWDYAESILETL
jgi:hypothetical protein